VITDAKYLIIVVPSFAFRETLIKISKYLVAPTNLIIATKGIEKNTFLTPIEITKEILSENAKSITILSGPTHAEEVIKRMVTLISAVSDNQIVREEVQVLFSNNYFRVYTNDDVIGVELGSTVKNILAIGAGLLDGMGYGDNAKAAMITRGLSELTALGTVIGANPATFLGLTGLGDLIVTCSSIHSRNRRFGELVGSGLSVDAALKKINMVVEGIHSLESIYQLQKKHNLNLAIIESIYEVIIEKHDPHELLAKLMNRSGKKE